METRNYTITINTNNSDKCTHRAWISDGWVEFKAIRMSYKDKFTGLNWRFDNREDGKYPKTKAATFLAQGINYACEKLVELKDGLKFNVAIANDEYERPVVSDITMERKSNSGSTNVKHNDDAATLASELLN